MRTFTSNLIILSATINDTTISGQAIDSDILINYSMGLNEVNKAILVPEANLVVTGSLRIDPKAVCSINVWVNSVVAIVSLPETQTLADNDTEIEKTLAPKTTKKTTSRKKAVIAEPVANMPPF